MGGSVAFSDVVVITGANNGIGLGLARALAPDGCRVACLGLSGESLSDLWFLRCDVTDHAQVEAAVTAVIAQWGQIDVLVNNACVAVLARFEEKALDATRREFEVNYFGYVPSRRSPVPWPSNSPRSTSS